MNSHPFDNSYDFKEHLNSIGISNLPEQIDVNYAKFQRFGKDKKYSILFNGDFGYFKDWSGELEESLWFSNGRIKKTLTSEEKSKLDKRLKEEKDLKSKEHESASIEANELWNSLSLTGESIYLDKKKLSAIDGIRFYKDSSNGYMATALVDNYGKIWNLQRIFDKPLYKDKTKFFLKNGKKSALYSLFGNTESDIIYICEGVSTGMSILLAEPKSLVVISYDCYNLKLVTKNILSKFPNRKIIIAGDNDQFKDKNIGKEKAEEIAREYSVGLVIPTFKNLSTKPTDFNDLYSLETVGEVRKQLSNVSFAQDLLHWDSPALFDNHETPNIPAEILPKPLKEFAQEIANSTETPEGMSVMAILSVVATSLQGKFEVQASENSGFKEGVNIYSITTLPPANRKSAIVRACLKPLAEWEKDQREILEPELKKQQSRYESQKKQIDLARKKLKLGDESRDEVERIAKIESEMKEPDNLPRLFVDDITPESLTILVSEQNNKMSVFSDEGGILDTMAGLYSGGHSNVDILLKGWDGGYLRQKRKDRELELNPLLTISLTVQPVIIKNFGNKKSYSGKGLLERFLYCLPKSQLGYRSNDKPPVSDKAQYDYDNTIKNLLNITHSDFPKVLILDSDSHKIWRDFQNSIEIDLRDDGKFSICQGWGGKICGYALRIAGLMHVIQYGTSSLIINKQTTERAIKLCSLLSDHAIVAFGSMESDPDIHDSKEILRWILNRKQDSFIKADLTIKFHNRPNMKSERIDKLLSVLSQRNMIAELPKKGKKTICYAVNPILFKEKNDK